MNPESQQQPPIEPQLQTEIQQPQQPTNSEGSIATSTPPSSIAPDQPKPIKSRKVILYVTIAVLVIGIAIAASWLIFDNEKAQNTQPQPKTTSNTSSTADLSTTALKADARMIKRIQDAVTKDFKVASTNKVLDLKHDEVSIYIDKQAPEFKVEGYNFYTDSAGGSSITIESYRDETTKLPTAIEKDVRIKIASVLTSSALTMTGSRGTEEYGLKTDVYIGDELICTVNSPLAETHPTTVRCGFLSSYLANAVKSKPLADALPNLIPTSVIFSPTISDSKVAGYQNAEAGISDLSGAGGYQALFWRKGSGSWNFFRGTQEIIQCAAYDTIDLKNAFFGKVCFDMSNNKDSTVK